MRWDWNILNYLRNCLEYEGAMHGRIVVEINQRLISTIQPRHAWFDFAHRRPFDLAQDRQFDSAHRRRADEAMLLDAIAKRLPADPQLSGSLGDVPFGQS